MLAILCDGSGSLDARQMRMVKLLDTAWLILEEAKRLARGNMVSLVPISDTAWCQSFRTGRSPKDEEIACFEQAYRTFAGKLNVFLVALGVGDAPGFEQLLDDVVAVSA